MTLIHIEAGQVNACANWGRWVSRCSRCPSAMTLDPGCSAFTCRECDAVTEVRWPTDAMIEGVERLLMMRPDVTTRNWEPDETLVDLMVDNASHGIFDALDIAPGVSALTVAAHTILRDALPVSPLRPLKAVGA